MLASDATVAKEAAVRVLDGASHRLVGSATGHDMLGAPDREAIEGGAGWGRQGMGVAHGR